MTTTANPYSAPLLPNQGEASGQCVIGEGQAILDYDLSPEDLATWELSEFAFFRSVAGVLWALLIIIGILVVTLSLVVSPAPAVGKIMAGALVSMPLAGVAIMIPLTFRRQLHSSRAAKYRTARRDATGFRRVVCDSAGLSSHGQFASTAVRWNAVKRIVSEEEAIYIDLTFGGTIIIPRHIFATQQDSEHLIRQLHTLWSESRACDIAPHSVEHASPVCRNNNFAATATGVRP